MFASPLLLISLIITQVNLYRVFKTGKRPGDPPFNSFIQIMKWGSII